MHHSFTIPAATPDFVRPERSRAPRPLWHRMARRLAGLLAVCAPLMAQAAGAITLSDLGAAKDLTPERFVGMFSEFQFKLSRTVQKPESFLKSRSGDCDDFSTLAAAVLRQKGYTTRLVAVVMPREVHVVCYVMQSRGYLDYNRRKAAKPVVPCDGGLASIAASVARSFHTDWRSVSEFTFEDGSARFVETEFR